MKILVSAGEASGDRYAAELVAALRRRLPQAEFFGCAGKRLREQGVRAVVETESLAVVGIFEVLGHIPRIYGEFRKLLRAAEAEKPDLAILTDAPDFNLRVAAKLQRQGVPIVYYVAPQVWAWRSWRVRKLRRLLDLLLCIFPFEEDWFNRRGVRTVFVGHPLTQSLEPTVDRRTFLDRYELRDDQPILAMLPGSRRGEAERHLPAVLGALDRLRENRPIQAVLPASSTTGDAFFRQRIGGRSVTIVENDTHNALAHCDLALVASGTATVEAALLGAPMVVFYRVTPASWLVGKLLVHVPFYSMVNLLAERRVVPELIQGDCTAERLAAEAERLLADPARRKEMKRELAAIHERLAGDQAAAERAAEVVCDRFGWTL
ncbi:MAG: lipid-A-disaccharide synthase [Acidobacteria bacterium]|nr:lipid-A-disaccharide synthase [Acidobacteriota bacterium]